jgi:hypothetical protein
MLRQLALQVGAGVRAAIPPAETSTQQMFTAATFHATACCIRVHNVFLPACCRHRRRLPRYVVTRESRHFNALQSAARSKQAQRQRVHPTQRIKASAYKGTDLRAASATQELPIGTAYGMDWYRSSRNCLVGFLYSRSQLLLENILLTTFSFYYWLKVCFQSLKS